MFCLPIGWFLATNKRGVLVKLVGNDIDLELIVLKDSITS